ncbi:hypothetical protein Q5P01_023385 [Channa striata]|uniref:Ig-like domain-containing protein n=1 Tax=Channa striata TaxID=64152 RepID=A0AA88IP48_CHASR|nr:hypothetical protein Q5P01_023385 [Channa striata]
MEFICNSWNKKKMQMSALPPTFFVCLLACVLSCSASEGPLNISTEPGHTVTLTCRVTTKNPVTVVEWWRPDLETGSGGFVFFYRSGESDSEKQHPSFKNRVELKNKHLEEGDMSVILKNVTIKDNGTYECYVAEKGRSSQLITTINLTVVHSGGGAGHTEDGGGKDGHVGLAAGLPIVALLLVIAAIVLFYDQ